MAQRIEVISAKDFADDASRRVSAKDFADDASRRVSFSMIRQVVSMAQNAS